MANAVLSCELSEILETAGISMNSARPSKVVVREWSSSVIATVDRGIAEKLGSEAENAFMDLITKVDDLSPENFLHALQSYEIAGYVWNPLLHAEQRQMCRKPLRGWDLSALNL